MTTLRDRDGVVHERLDCSDGTFKPMCVVRDNLLDQRDWHYNADALVEFRMTCLRCITGNMQRRYWGRDP